MIRRVALILAIAAAFAAAQTKPIPVIFDTDMGPIISAEQKARIESYLKLAPKEGATVAFQGEVPEGPGHWVPVTILTDVTNDMRIAQEEIFGPVLCVLRYSDVQDAIDIANDTEYGLSAGVWSTDNQRALDVAGQLEAGTVWVNDWHMVNAAYPFGGYKQSGLGRELGTYGLKEYTEVKHIHVDQGVPRAERFFYDVVLS